MRLLLASSIVLAVAVSHTASGQTAVGAAAEHRDVPCRASSWSRSARSSATVKAEWSEIYGSLISSCSTAASRARSPSFRAEPAPVSVALLFDVSGSMQVAAKIEKARVAARHVLAWLQPGRDELAIYSFDTGLQQRQPFALYQQDAALERSLVGLAPWGMTSLNDAIAATARELAARPNAHRAVIVLTDGVDNNSRLSAAEVSGIASSIDVPVYILAVVSPLDHVGSGDGGELRAAGSGRRPGRPGPVDGRRVLRDEPPAADQPGRRAHRRGASPPVPHRVRAGEPARVAPARGAEPGGGSLSCRARSGYIAGSTKNGSSDSAGR